METNIVTPAEDADMVDCDGERVVTMMDVLQEQEDFENDANAVLGASDEKNCTYAKGFIKRQAIYACMTCCPEAKVDPTKRAGVCLACSLMCHENHDLIELYTKRNFRCDCGNPKFKSITCQYYSSKTDLNENNEYNQNFSGLYCVCKRPYPDPENSTEDEMIQCIICEDWLHGSHLEATLPPNDQYSEMICKTCMEKNLFLHDYSNIAVNIKDNDVDVLGDNTENSIINGDLNNETSDDTDEIQQSPSKERDVNLAGTEISEQNANVKDSNDTNAMPTDSDKTTEEVQELNSVTTKDVESNSITNEIDAESIEEDRLLADPEDGMEEHSKNSLVQSVLVDDQKNEKTPNEQDTKQVVSDDMENLGDHPGRSSKVVIDTETNDNKEISKDDNSEALKETNSDNLDNKEISKDDNSEALKETNSDNLDKENNTITEQDESSKKADENQHSEIDTTMNIKQNAETDISETGENTITNVSKTELTENIEKTDVSETSENNIEAVGVSKIDVENNIEVSNEAQSSNNDSNTNNNESNDSKTDLSEQSNETITQNNTDLSVTNMKVDEDNIDNAYDEKKNENDPNNVNSCEVKPIENKRKLSTEENINQVEDSGVSGKRIKLDPNCIRPKNVKRVYNGATFWPSDFRQKLCTCNECLTMYKDLSVLFLTDVEDTVRAYESLGEERERIEGKPASQYEKGLQALSSLDRIQQINAVTEFNKMRDKLVEFLKSFKDRKAVVKEEDIKEFFAGMKPKREPDGVYFCR